MTSVRPTAAIGCDGGVCDGVSQLPRGVVLRCVAVCLRLGPSALCRLCLAVAHVAGGSAGSAGRICSQDLLEIGQGPVVLKQDMKRCHAKP